MNWLDNIKWDDKGLVPVIAQEKDSGDVLMFAWMNREALQKTAVHDIRIDCDNDVVLLKVTQEGHEPGIACHTGRHSCFYQRLEGEAWHACEPVLKDPESIYK
jgi:phosphoribosyl-AMP cyclohydrolase